MELSIQHGTWMFLGTAARYRTKLHRSIMQLSTYEYACGSLVALMLRESSRVSPSSE
jgi:hypothetical protein